MGNQYRRRSPPEAIDDLLARPPASDDELAQRLRGVEHAGARRAILERLGRGDAARDESDLLAAALLHIGVGEETERLEALASDTSLPREARWIALSLLVSTGTERAARVLDGLSPDDRLELMLQPAAEAMRDVMADPALAAVIADSIAWAPPEARGAAAAYLEETRRGSGTPAVVAYRELIRREPPRELLEAALDAVVSDGGTEATTELAALRDGAKAPEARQAIQRALLRLGTYAIAPRPAEKAAHAQGAGFVGSCDGQGAFLVAGCFENPDGTRSFSSVCVRADGDVRSAFTVPAVSSEERGKLLDEMKMGGAGDIAEIPLWAAAELVAEGLARTRAAGAPMPEDAATAALLFERARDPSREERELPPPDPPDPPGARRVTEGDARSLLSLPIYQTWFFDRGDLASSGALAAGSSAPRGGRGALDEAWASAALEKLERSEVRPRLVAMLEHMTSWHARRGEERLASTCAAAAAEAKQGLSSGALPRLMLERSVEVLARGQPGTIVGDAAVRGRLRLQFFPGVTAPKGADLAALDLCEATYEALHREFELLPMSRRPRDGETAAAAFKLAALFTGQAFSAKRRSIQELEVAMTDALCAATRLERDEGRAAVRVVLDALAAFLAHVCGRCPVMCHATPRADMAGAFFAASHPALGRSPRG